MNSCPRCEKPCGLLMKTTEGLLCEDCVAERMIEECELALDERDNDWEID